MDLRNGSVVAVLLGALALAAPAHAAPPPNDNFANREVLSGTALSVPGTTLEATEEAGDPRRSRNVWYSWTPPQDMVVQLDTCSSPNGFVTDIWSGATLNSLEELDTRDDEPFPVGCPAGPPFYDLHLYDVTGGTTYAISVFQLFLGRDGPFTLNLSTIPRPPNDDFAAAQDLGQALDVDVDGTTAGARPESGEPGNSDRGNSVWYRWTAPRNTRVWIDNCNAETESSRVTVYKGGSLGALTMVDDDTFGTPQPAECEGNGARYEFLATGGTTYMIQVLTQRRDHGAFHLRMRDIRFDASLHQTASAKKVKKGKRVTYTIDVENLGTVEIDSEVNMVTSKPDHLTKPVKATKYLSVEGTNGTKCKPEMMLANPHPGASCDIKLDPGESTRIVAKVKPDQSLSHWAALDFVDENLDNEDDKPVNVTVKPRRKHR